MLSGEIYGKDVSHLSEDEKTTLSAFASLAAGLAGGLAGGSTQDALMVGRIRQHKFNRMQLIFVVLYVAILTR